MLDGIDFSLLALDSPGWGGALLEGFLVSIQLAAGGYLLGLAIGICGAVAKLYGGRVTRDLAEIYTIVIRAVPELVLMLLFYYVGTDLANRAMQAMGYSGFDIDGLTAGILVIGLVQGGYATEVIRGAIRAVPHGQIEAAQAFGMAPLKVLRRVTLPAATPHAIPGMANLWMIATKDTALLAVIGFSELTLVTRQAASATRAYFLFFLAAGALYLLLTLVSNLGLRLFEKRARRGLAEVR
ncbi:ABC transporter permease [Pseudoroseicyclus aestuarii]|uniref:Amino acid ABC transporter membrane protein 1 (PAAT family) n=1 Tax=Pseudoroseicyclus aestuarii TaxID=1795041 RepID=A0A318T928_9RHOB|nr:ABC transporter permease subunit [Pseudoroseicyclus aestuarii]PYE84858.1 amino acid ABC transporter membrane protein 1 (PAAT family) [Pseudoroseicyclus aestuarii]